MTNSTCAIDGCAAERHGTTWCDKHYRRWRKHGDPLWCRPTHLEILTEWVATRERDVCWEWPWGRDQDGYGTLSVKGQGFRAHRYAALLDGRPIPDGFVSLHSCDNPPCVNPDHIAAGSTADNNADRDAKGRTSRGVTHSRGQAKLSFEIAAVIRTELTQGALQRDLAAKYGVSPSQISAIKTRSQWWPVPATIDMARQAVNDLFNPDLEPVP